MLNVVKARLCYLNRGRLCLNNYTSSVEEPIAEYTYSKLFNHKIYIFRSEHTSPYPFFISPLPFVKDKRAIMAWTKNDKLESLYEGASENDAFVAALHQSIRDNPETLIRILQSRATLTGDSWIHLTDERGITPFGRTPEPDDIIGMCYVQGGTVLAESYTPMPTYRLVSRSGLMCPPRLIYDNLLKHLNQSDNRIERPLPSTQPK